MSFSLRLCVLCVSAFKSGAQPVNRRDAETAELRRDVKDEPQVAAVSAISETGSGRFRNPSQPRIESIRITTAAIMIIAVRPEFM